MSARLIGEELYGSTVWKTYRLHDGNLLLVHYKKNGKPAAWFAQPDTRRHRITTEAAAMLLGRILAAGKVLPQRVRTQYEIRPIPQVTPHHILLELNNPPTEPHRV
jgi:hypothetical protein